LLHARVVVGERVAGAIQRQLSGSARTGSARTGSTRTGSTRTGSTRAARTG